MTVYNNNQNLRPVGKSLILDLARKFSKSEYGDNNSSSSPVLLKDSETNNAEKLLEVSMQSPVSDLEADFFHQAKLYIRNPYKKL